MREEEGGKRERGGRGMGRCVDFLCIFIIFSSVESSVCCGKDQAQSQARDCNEYTTSEPERERDRERENYL